MKKLRLYLTLLLTIMSVTTFTSCEKTAGGNDSFIVGTWKGVFDSYENSYIMATFNADGTGNYFEYDNGRVEYSDSFTYVCDEKNEILSFNFREEGYATVRFTKQSDKIVIVYFEGEVVVFEKQ